MQHDNRRCLAIGQRGDRPHGSERIIGVVLQRRTVEATNATADIAGTFVYTPASGTTLSAGLNQPLAATFTPTDTATMTWRSQPGNTRCVEVVGDRKVHITHDHSKSEKLLAGQAIIEHSVKN